MIVNRIRLANVRAIESLELRFEHGFNLVVGVNGVGKTSVLDALSVSLSAIMKQTNQLRSRAGNFSVEDIRSGTEALTVECQVRVGSRDFTYLVHKPRSAIIPRKGAGGTPREQVYDTPERAEFVGELPRLDPLDLRTGRPLAVLFSTTRALPTDRSPSKEVASSGVAAAFADAFRSRELRLGEFAAWIRVQETLRSELPAVAHTLQALNEAVQRFLPGYSNLHLAGNDKQQLCIDRRGTELPVKNLSDGERGTLALVLDLTRRLAQANPDLTDPSATAEAIVLIDEIDLHLHPRWQRQIVHNLEAAFPRCQFIATSHSPQVIGEVQHERIQIISDGVVYSPQHSYGVDSSRLLEEVMDTAPRTREVGQLLSAISRATSHQEYGEVRSLLGVLVENLGENDPEVTRLRLLLDFLESSE